MSEQEKLKEGDVQTRIRRGTFTPHGLGHGVSVQDVEVVAHDKNLEVAFVQDPFEFEPTKSVTLINLTPGPQALGFSDEGDGK